MTNYMDISQQVSLCLFAVVRLIILRIMQTNLVSLKCTFLVENPLPQFNFFKPNNTTIKDRHMLCNPEPDLESIPVSSAGQY